MLNENTTPMTTRRIAAGGITLGADFGGDPESKTVLLMHGGGQTRHAWRCLASELIRASYHVVSLDWRGHGESDWSPDGVYGIDVFEADLRDVLNQVPPRPVLVGASLGGVVSLRIASKAPDAVSALVLVDVVPAVNHEGANRITGFMRANPEGFASLNEAADAVAAYLPHRPRPKSNSGLMKNLRLKSDGRYYWHWDPKLFSDSEVPEAQRETIVRQLEQDARQVNVPTLLLRGTHSEIVTEDGARRFQSMIAGSEWVDVKGARHMVAGDNNDAFSAALIEFLKRKAPPERG